MSHLRASVPGAAQQPQRVLATLSRLDLVAAGGLGDLAGRREPGERSARRRAREPRGAASSPAVIALPSPSAARIAALVAPGAVRARAGTKAAARLAGAAAGRAGAEALRVRGAECVAPRGLFAGVAPTAERLGAPRTERPASLSRVVSAASARRRRSISPSSSSMLACMARMIWSITGIVRPCVSLAHRDEVILIVTGGWRAGDLELPDQPASTLTAWGGACLAAREETSRYVHTGRCAARAAGLMTRGAGALRPSAAARLRLCPDECLVAFAIAGHEPPRASKRSPQ